MSFSVKAYFFTARFCFSELFYLPPHTLVGRHIAPFRFAVHHCGRDPTQTSLVSCVVCRAGAQLFRHVSAFDRLGHVRCYGSGVGPRPTVQEFSLDSTRG